MTTTAARRKGGENLPLEGLRVFDLTRVIAGPFCTMMLADMGADVIKIEEPKHGDELRWVGRYKGRKQHDEDYFYASNRSKRSVALDLKDERQRKIALALIEKSDVLVENFSPGVTDRLGRPALVAFVIAGIAAWIGATLALSSGDVAQPSLMSHCTM